MYVLKLYFHCNRGHMARKLPEFFSCVLFNLYILNYSVLILYQCNSLVAFISSRLTLSKLRIYMKKVVKFLLFDRFSND